MSAGKIKIVLILAGLILGAGLLSTLTRKTDASSPAADLISSADDTTQATDGQKTTGAATTVGQSGIAGGRELFYKMLLSVLLVAGLGVMAVYVSKKWLPRIARLPAKQIRVVETTYIAPRKGIHLIQIGHRRLLVGSTNENITMLGDVTDSAGDFAIPAGGFAAELEKRK